MQSTPERPQATEHCRWLDQLNVFMQVLWKTVARRSNDALSAVRVSVDVIFLRCSVWLFG